MKKKLLAAALALPCAFACAFSLAACGDDPATTNEVSEAEWKTAMSDFVDGKNFTLTMTANNTVVNKMKLDGAKYYEFYGTAEEIHNKDGNNYYNYIKQQGASDWSLNTRYSQSQYEQNINESYGQVAFVTSAIAQSKASFTYTDGKYVTTSFTVGNMELKDVKITFTNKVLTNVVYIQPADSINPELTVTINAIGSTTVPIPDIQSISVESITLSKNELKMEYNTSTKLTATVLPENASNKTVVWSSDNEKIATVKDGVVTAGSITGTATITAIAEGDKAATCTVNVVAELPFEEVSAKQWEQAFVEMKELLKTNASYESAQDRITFYIDGDSYYYEHLNEKYYRTKIDDTYYEYDFTEDGWTRKEIEEDEYKFYVYRMLTNFFNVNDLQSQYDKFSYENDAYRANYVASISHPAVSFKNGSIFKVEYGTEQDGFSVFYDFGSTELELPEKYIEAK